MPHSRVLPTPSIPHPRHGTTFYGASTITAPAALIWSTLLDFPAYPSWNTLTPDPRPINTAPLQAHAQAQAPSSSTATANAESHFPPLKPGLELTFAPNNSNERAATSSPQTTHTRVRLTLIDQSSMKLSWKRIDHKYPPWLLQSERVMQVLDFKDGKCEVRNYETVTGLLVPFVKWREGGGGGGGGRGGLDEALRRMTEELGVEVGRRLGSSGGDGGGMDDGHGVVNQERAVGEHVLGAGDVASSSSSSSVS